MIENARKYLQEWLDDTENQECPVMGITQICADYDTLQAKLTTLEAENERLEKDAVIIHRAIPSGTVLVPVEPTEEMIEAGSLVLHTIGPETFGTKVLRIYKAMIAASKGE